MAARAETEPKIETKTDATSEAKVAADKTALDTTALKLETKSKTLTKRAAPAEPAEPIEAHSQRKRAETGRFLLQVDRQTKRSYGTLEAAMKAGTEIKTGHPNVQVGVYDAVDCVNSPVETVA